MEEVRQLDEAVRGRSLCEVMRRGRTSSLAAGLIARPRALVTTAWYSPDSANVTLLSVSVLLVAASSGSSRKYD